jgi:hypothetical protein
LGSSGFFNDPIASDRTVGPIFAAQPQVRASPVKVFFFLMKFIRSHFVASFPGKYQSSPSRVKYIILMTLRALIGKSDIFHLWYHRKHAPWKGGPEIPPGRETEDLLR